MKTHGKITQYNCSYFYLIKPHFCSKCNTRLKRSKREVVVNSESNEARNYDFSFIDTYLRGNIIFVTFYFECPNCGEIYEIDELKTLEKKGNKR